MREEDVDELDEDGGECFEIVSAEEITRISPNRSVILRRFIPGFKSSTFVSNKINMRKYMKKQKIYKNNKMIINGEREEEWRGGGRRKEKEWWFSFIYKWTFNSFIN